MSLTYSGVEPQPSLAWTFESSNVDIVTGLAPSSQVSPGPAQLQGSAALVTNAPTSNTAVYFPGTSGSYMNLGTSSPSSFSLVTSNILVEAWIYLTSIPTQNVGIMARSDPLAPANSDFRLLIDSTGAPLFFIRSLNSSIVVGSPLTLNQWYHVSGSWSLIPSSNTVAVFTNGTLNQSKTELTATLYSSTRETHIGYYNGGYFPGYIRDLRVVQGGVVPTTSFTPGSAPFSYTLPSYVTGSGSVVFTLLGQFVTYNPSGKYGASLLMGGQCNLRYNYPSAIPLDTGGAAISMWLKPLSLPASGVNAWLFGSYGSGNGDRIYAFLYSDGGIWFYFRSTGGDVGFRASGVALGTWCHLSFVLGSNNGTLYLNGNVVNSLSCGMAGLSLDTRFGLATLSGGSSPYINAEFDDLRIYNTALTAAQVQSVYSSQGAPAPSRAMPLPRYAWDFQSSNVDYVSGLSPTTSLGPPTYTSGKYGQAIQFTNSAGGTPSQSIAYPVSLPSSSGLTVSFWVNFNTYNVGFQTSVSLGDGSSYLNIYGTSVIYLYWGRGSTVVQANPGFSYSTGTWYHIAVCYSAQTVTLYINGTGTVATLYISGTPSGTNVGADTTFTTAYLGGSNTSLAFNGLIDDLRIYNTALTAAQVRSIWAQQGVPGRGVQNATGLAFYAPFNGSTTDSIGSITASNAFGIQSSNVILNSNAIYDTGLFSQSINVYNTSSTYYGNVLAYQLTTSTPPPYTISFWFKLNTILGIANEQVVIFRTVNNSFFFKIFINSLTQLTAQIGVYDGSGAVQYPVGFGSGSNLNLNGWNFYCLVVQPNQAVTYVANTSSTIIQTSTASPSSGYTFNNLDTIFGTMYNGGVSNTNRPFCGNIDELRIFKYNLTNSAVQALYSSTTPSTFNPPSILMSGTPLFTQLSTSATSSAVGAFSLRAVNGTSARAVQVRPVAAVPAAAMSSNGPQTLTGYSFGGGGSYTASVSSFGGSSFGWKVFDKDINTYWNTNYTYTGTGANSSNTYIVNTYSTTVSGSTVYGEWIQIQMPTAIYPYTYTLTPPYDAAVVQRGFPYQWTLAGSNDGAMWTTVDTQNGINTWTNLTPKTFTSASSSTAYSYYRLIVQAVNSYSTLTSQLLNISEWTVNGSNASWNTDFYADRLGNLLTAPVTGQSLASWLGGGTGYVTTWYDQSGRGNNATQATAANQPIITRATKGPGYACVFNGTTNYMNFGSSTILNGTNYSMCGITRRNTSSSQKYYIGSNGAGSTRQNLAVGYFDNTTIIINEGGYATSTAVPAYSTGSEPTGYDFVMLSQTTGAYCFCWRNGTSYSGGNSGVNLPLNSAGVGIIGAVATNGSYGGYFSGEMFELIIFTASLFDLSGSSIGQLTPIPSVISQIYNNQLGAYGT